MTSPEGYHSSAGNDYIPKIKSKEEIHFSSQNFCVCLVDIVGSTKTTARIVDVKKIRNYYTIFLNTMSMIAGACRAKIIKNTGDCLILYFPDTKDTDNSSAFNLVMECGLMMLGAHAVINKKLETEGLPFVDYRISADYGRLDIARSKDAQVDDLFGPTMNLCAGINSKAPSNSMVIGGDLYRLIKSFSSKESYSKYTFKDSGEYSIGFKQTYPVYLLTTKIDITWTSYDELCHHMTHLLKNAGIGHSDIISSHPFDSLQNLGKNNIDETIKKEVSSDTQNIILIDDEADILLTYKSFLDTEGYKIATFSDSDEALDHITRLDPSFYKLAILDIRMPSLNGLQLYHRLKAINSSMKILFVSALDAAEEVLTIVPELTYGDFMKKPVNQKHFLARVKELLS